MDDGIPCLWFIAISVMIVFSLKYFCVEFYRIFQTNDTDLGEIKVFRGVKNYKDVGRVISVNGDTGTMIIFVFLFINSNGKDSIGLLTTAKFI